MLASYLDESAVCYATLSNFRGYAAVLRNQLGDKVQFKVTQRSSSGVVGEVSVPAVKSDKATAATVVKVTIEACCNSLFVICKSYQYFQQSSNFLLTLFHFVRIHTPTHTYTHKRTHTHSHTHTHTHTHTGICDTSSHGLSRSRSRLHAYGDCLAHRYYLRKC